MKGSDSTLLPGDPAPSPHTKPPAKAQSSERTLRTQDMLLLGGAAGTQGWQGCGESQAEMRKI